MPDAIRCVANDVVNECFGCGCGSCWALYVLMKVKGRQHKRSVYFFTPGRFGVSMSTLTSPVHVLWDGLFVASLLNSPSTVSSHVW